jgi:hypothetical protein
MFKVAMKELLQAFKLMDMLMFTDNACAEVKFHEAATPSLKKNVVHVELDKYAHLPRLQLPDPSNVSVVVHYESDMIDNACDNLLQQLHQDSSSHLVVALDIKYEVEPDGKGGCIPQKTTGCDVFQIAVTDVIYIFKITSFLSKASAPPNLLSLLMSPQVIKVGSSITPSLHHLADMWNLKNLHVS